ncbi:MAG: hypothetical protein HOE11_00170, partial [Candidatus Diapherotrites archaeon]|nr:hypothetical protein [Candidatus Diapherotrites archaeon]
MDYKKQMERYIERLEGKTGKHNADLIKKFNEKQQALPSQPGYKRLIVTLHRLSSISQMMKHKEFDKLTEDDLIKFNNTLRNRGLKSASDYRKTIKMFLRLTNKKKFFDLIDSEYLRNYKTNGSKAVNPEEF